MSAQILHLCQHLHQRRYAAPKLAQNDLRAPGVSSVAAAAAIPGDLDGSFDDDEYVNPATARAPPASAAPVYGKPVTPVVPLPIETTEGLYDVPSMAQSTSGQRVHETGGTNLPTEDADAMYENADPGPESMYGNTDAAGKSLLVPRGRKGTFDVATALENPVLIPEPTLADLDQDGDEDGDGVGPVVDQDPNAITMVPEIGHPDGEDENDDEDISYGWGDPLGNGDTGSIGSAGSGEYGTMDHEASHGNGTAAVGPPDDDAAAATAEVPDGFGAFGASTDGADGDSGDSGEPLAKKPWKPKPPPPPPQPETVVEFVPAVDYSKVAKWTAKTAGAPAPQEQPQSTDFAVDYSKAAKWAPKPKTTTRPTPPKAPELPGWKTNVAAPVFGGWGFNTRTDEDTNAGAESTTRRTSKFGGANTNTKLQQVGGLDESMVSAFMGTADEAASSVELVAAPRIVAREWTPEVRLDAATKPKPALTVGKLDVK